MNQKTLTVLILFISGFFINPLYAEEAKLTVENAWISEAPPVSKVMVAYMTINNTGNEAIDITKAESELYSSIEFHETIHENGMARMVRWGELTVPANGSIQLKRGGKHFMLFNPTKHLKAGETVRIKLTTNNKTTKTILVTVKKAQY
jgi:copper(I)-binding protein